MHRVHQYDHVLKTKMLNRIAFREDGWGIVLTFLFPLFSLSSVVRFFFWRGGEKGEEEWSWGWAQEDTPLFRLYADHQEPLHIRCLQRPVT